MKTRTLSGTGKRMPAGGWLAVAFIGFALSLAPRPARAEQSANAPSSRPNIIVILVDDMGFSDLGCYGGEIPTPNLDRLATNGLRFTQFYNTGRCCPTRAALPTGLYAHQAGVGHMVENKGVPGYRGHLNDSCVTIAEVLKPAGYFTALSGKWHVGQESGVTPWGRGFDRSLNAAAGGFYYPESSRAKLFLNGSEIANDDERLPKNWYSTDLWTTFGLRFIDEAVAEKKPFYLHLCHNAPHFPLQAPAEEIAKFRGKYKAGWEAIAGARYAKQRELGIIDKAWAKARRPEAVQPWKDLPADEQERFDHLMAAYAAVVHRMDKAVGDLVAGLKQRGVFENTLILFMSDNGGNAEGGPKGTTSGDPSTAKSSWFCGMSWAFVENTPFRLYKHYNHEGGIATPLIAHWPAGIAAKGELRTQPAHLIDIMSTCTDVGGATYPKEFKGKPIIPMISRNSLFRPRHRKRLESGLGPEERGGLMLAVSGKLDLRVGGPGFDLFEPNENYVKVYKTRTEYTPEEFRRMVYQSKPRAVVDDFFGAFDCPDAGQPAPRRTASTTPLQALNLLNGGFALQQAGYLAERVRKEAGEQPEAQIRRLHALVYNRPPSPEDLSDSAALLRQHGLQTLCRGLLNSNEFIHLY